MARARKVHVVCPLPKESFPWENHYDEWVKVGRNRPVICPVCGLNLRDFKAVAEAIFKRYVEFLGRHGDEVEIEAKEYLELEKIDNPKIIRNMARLLAKVRGRSFLLIVVSPDPETPRLLEYYVYVGEGDDKRIVMRPFGANGLGLAMQLTHIPGRPAPIFTHK